MKNTKLASALALAMGMAAIGTANAQTVGNGGTIAFHGEVTDSTCTVRGGAGTDPTPGSDLSVTLQGVPASTFTTAVQTAGFKTFNVEIGAEGETTCGATSGGGSVVASMSFVRGNIDTNGNLFNGLAAADGGTNAQIQLTLPDATPIRLGASNAGLQSATIVDNQATLTYGVQYFSDLAAATTPGKLETYVTYQIAYQ
jgi:major type 1 subunit fimbrin (pilin)